MTGYFVVVCFLGLVYQCSTKHVSEEIFRGYSGDGSGEVEDAITTHVSIFSTTTITMLNDNNDIDDVIPAITTPHTNDDIYINQTSDVDPSIKERNDTPTRSGDISTNKEAIIGLVIVASITFCIIAVLVALILRRKWKAGTKIRIPTVYPNSRKLFLTSTEICSKSTEVLDVSGSAF